MLLTLLSVASHGVLLLLLLLRVGLTAEDGAAGLLLLLLLGCAALHDAAGIARACSLLLCISIVKFVSAPTVAAAHR